MRIRALVLTAALAVSGVAWGQGDAGTVKIDFGNGAAQQGWTKVASGDAYSPERGYGFVGESKLDWRDRKAPDPLRADYLFARTPATFRIKVPKPGLYRLTLITGDTNFGDHVLAAKVDVEGVDLPTVQPSQGVFATVSAAFEIKKDTLDVTLNSPANNYVLNALSLEPASATAPATVEPASAVAKAPLDWAHADTWPDPTKAHVEKFKGDVKQFGDVHPTGLTRDDYLKVIAGNVDFFKQHQNPDGAILDPYKKAEWQYSTPCFAYACAELIAHADRKDLIEPASKAMDWATKRLSIGEAANHHEDFYAPVLAHAMPLLKPHIPADRYETWAKNLSGFDPYKVYHAKVGGGNWNVVALSGEWLFHKQGLRADTRFVEESLGAQSREFADVWGLYHDPNTPMAYDLFPRLWASDMVASGYDGQYAKPLGEVLRRGALASLLMQSPTGELPTGGRSAQHQWNEAEQCVVYEIYAAYAKQAGDETMARAFKRGSRLALASMKRWVRPSGELQIVKNYVDPEQRFGYEGYSAHSQYNLLPMAMLAIAYEHAARTDDVKEGPAPADVGGFVLDLRENVHKVIANASGTYVEIDTAADPHYNATGLLRVHRSGVNPQIGPSDALTAEAESQYPKDAQRTTAAVGVAWKATSGEWTRLAEFTGQKITAAKLDTTTEDVKEVKFSITYQGEFAGPKSVTENYEITPGKVTQTSQLSGYTGPVRLVFPLLVDNGKEKSKLETSGNTVSLGLEGSTVSFTAPDAQKVTVDDEKYPSRNGWYQLGSADFPDGTNKATLVIEPKGPTK